VQWKQAVRYCGFDPRGAGLAKKARGKRTLTPGEVRRVLDLAEQAEWIVGTENLTVPAADYFPLQIPAKYKVFGKQESFTLVRKKNWVVEPSSGEVVGRYGEGGVLTLYPNSHILLGHLSGLLVEGRGHQ
jgi:hypothetical protein